MDGELLAQLSPEDLNRWRLVMADKELIDCGYSGYSVIEARQVILKYYQTLSDILTTYSIEIFPGSHFIVSPIQGHVLRVHSD
jgi:hypothetical protein